MDIAEKEFNFGKIKDDQIVEHIFRIFNSGRDTLHITSVRTSCGCTATLVSNELIPPGGSGEIKTTLNPRGKSGPIKKAVTIYSNAEGWPMVPIYVLADIIPGEKHPAVDGDMHGSYFAGKCVNCHVEPGIGKYGEALFEASCQMCHGLAGLGGVAFALNKSEYLKNVDKKYLKDRITNGSPKNHMMLGFSKEKGGPLDEKQIDSLVEYIVKWAKSN